MDDFEATDYEYHFRGWSGILEAFSVQATEELLTQLAQSDRPAVLGLVSVPLGELKCDFNMLDFTNSAQLADSLS